MESIQAIKQRFEIIGNDVKLNRAIEKSIQVAPTDISVLVTGESGVGKEAIPKIIHSLSHRKHAKYIAVNCGAIPEGTIDSELFGHEKGAFTGATSTRSGIRICRAIRRFMMLVVSCKSACCPASNIQMCSAPTMHRPC